MISPPVANVALIAGEVHATLVPTAGLSMALRGVPLRILYTTFYRPMVWLFAKPEIRSVQDLKGKRMGMSGPVSADGVLLEEFLTKHGLVPDRDVPLLRVGNTNMRFTALMSGSIDAATLFIPWNLMAKERGFRELASFMDEDMVLLFGSIVVHERLLKTDRNFVEKFIRGTMKGHRHVIEDKSAFISALVRNLKISEEIATKSYEATQAGIAPDGTVDEALQRKYFGLVAKLRKIKDPPDFKQFFDFSLVRKVAAELKAKGWKPGR